MTSLTNAARALCDGHLVVFPTETVYGLGADGLCTSAVEGIFRIKGRPADHPVILHVATIDAAKSLTASWPARAQRLAEVFWPGPLTLILKRASHIPDAVTGGQETVGIRIPAQPVALALLNEFSRMGSGVIAAPSANRFGAVSPTRVIDVQRDLGDRLGPDDCILDGGDCTVGVESTIVDLTGTQPRILRPGGISRDRLIQVMAVEPAADSEILSKDCTTLPPRVSGALQSHYAPNARVMLLNSEECELGLQQLRAASSTSSIGCLLMKPLKREPSGQEITVVVMPSDAQRYAHDLYARLHDLDQLGCRVIVVERPPQSIEWEAVQDRLKRAAADRPNPDHAQ